MKGILKAADRLGLFTLLLICGVSLPALSGLLVFPFSLIRTQMTLTYSIGLCIIFLFSTAFSYWNESLKRYWMVFSAFFIASFAILVDISVNIPATTMDGIVLDMLLSATLIVIPIVSLTRITGSGMASIFLKKGDLKLGLIIGLAGFLIFAAVSPQAAAMLFQGRNLSLERVISWAPWVLAVVMANGLREELLYRGLFLKRYETLLGPNISNLLQAIIFSLSHTVAGTGATAYTPFTAVFVLITFVLGLAWGYVMQRTDSLLGPVLFHAGSDIPVFIGIFSNLP